MPITQTLTYDRNLSHRPSIQDELELCPMQIQMLKLFKGHSVQQRAETNGETDGRHRLFLLGIPDWLMRSAVKIVHYLRHCGNVHMHADRPNGHFFAVLSTAKCNGNNKICSGLGFDNSQRSTYGYQKCRLAYSAPAQRRAVKIRPSVCEIAITFPQVGCVLLPTGMVK